MSTHLSDWIPEWFDVPRVTSLTGSEPGSRLAGDPVPPLLRLRQDMNVRRGSPVCRHWERHADEILTASTPSQSADMGSRPPQTRHPLLTWIPADAHEPVDHIRLVYWPLGVPNGPFLGVLSSRLRRDLGSHRDWFAALRELDESLSPGIVLVTAQSTTPFPFLQRLSTQRARPSVTLHCPSQERSSPHQWWRRVKSLSLPAHSERYPAILSPLLPVPAGHFFPELAGNSASPGITSAKYHRADPRRLMSAAPLADRAVARLSDQLIVLRLRKQSRLLPWLRGLLAHPPLPHPLWLAVGPELVAPSEAKQLVRLGASWWRSFQKQPRRTSNYPLLTGDSSSKLAKETVWNPDASNDNEITTVDNEITTVCNDGAVMKTVWNSPPDPTSVATQCTTHAASPTRGNVRGTGQQGLFRPKTTPAWTYLTHCTRRQDGPWPEQTKEQYWDDLLWDRPAGDHSALETLRRIVNTRQLLGSSRGIRGGSHVVCWTEVPLPQLAELHVYRPHRVRWDFCPYGICIERAWLEERGARPVLYAPSSRWVELPDEERPFFQYQPESPTPPPASQLNTESPPTCDWRSESEWRTLGDLDLQDLPARLAFVFVPTIREAESLASCSPWPVYQAPHAGVNRP